MNVLERACVDYCWWVIASFNSVHAKNKHFFVVEQHRRELHKIIVREVGGWDDKLKNILSRLDEVGVPLDGDSFTDKQADRLAKNCGARLYAKILVEFKDRPKIKKLRSKELGLH